MSQAPTLMTRVRAKLAGEVAVDTVDAYRRAGASAYDLIVEAEQKRAEIEEDDYWQVPASACPGRMSAALTPGA